MRNSPLPAMRAALCAAAMTAQFVSGQAVRDALFLTTFDVSALPAMLIATAVCSILLFVAHARWARGVAPAIVIPAAFTASGVLSLIEWLLRPEAPSATAVLVYLHIAGAAPLLASGFWMVAGEALRSARAERGFGRVAGAGTLGGILGAVLSERAAVALGLPSMLLVFAVFQFSTAVLVRLLAVDMTSAAALRPLSARSLRSGVRRLAESVQLRHLMAVVLLGTTSAALIDYVFKAQAIEAFGPGDSLLRFFALYYAAISVVSFVLHLLSSRVVLEKFGVAPTIGTPSIALLAGTLANVLAPGFGSLLVSRGSEAIIRASWFRAGAAVLYATVPSNERRAAKSIVDIAIERLGDATAGGLVRVAILFVPAIQSHAILTLTLTTSIGAIFAATYLNGVCLQKIEDGPDRGASGSDVLDKVDPWLARPARDGEQAWAQGSYRGPFPDDEDAITTRPTDPLVRDILALRSSRRDLAIRVLSRDEVLAPALVRHVIPLLAEDALADYALFALCKVAEEGVGQLADAMLDHNQSEVVRRRVARVLSVCVSQRATDALVLALDDARFDIRFQAARSLSAILGKNPRVQIEAQRIYEVVLREVAVGRPVWESHRLLDGFVNASPLDEFVRDRAGQSLAHVFTLLSLVLPRDPLQISFRGLNGDDPHLRGTALEYLDGVLPARVRQELWPLLVGGRTATVATAGSHETRLAELLRASDSITVRRMVAGWERERVAGSDAV